jgi:transposase
MTTKIVALTDALGNLVDFRLLPGQAHDLRGVPELIDTLAADHLLADRAFDADWLRTALSERSITPVIPPKSNRRFPAEFDKETYKWRHLIENHFGKLKENRGIAMRSCKTPRLRCSCAWVSHFFPHMGARTNQFCPRGGRGGAGTCGQGQVRGPLRSVRYVREASQDDGKLGQFLVSLTSSQQIFTKAGRILCDPLLPIVAFFETQLRKIACLERLDRVVILIDPKHPQHRR